jgi:hypothetical protein
VSEGEAEVRLTIPPEPRFLRLARLAASGVGAELDLPLRAIDDLRVAVDELSAVLIDGARAPLELVFRLHPGCLRIEGWCEDPSPVELDEVAREVLALTADDYQVGDTDGCRTFRLVVEVDRG